MLKTIERRFSNNQDSFSPLACMLCIGDVKQIMQKIDDPFEAFQRIKIAGREYIGDTAI